MSSGARVHRRVADLLRSARCYDEGEEGWLCEIPGEEDLWARGRTPEEALAELATLLEEEMEEEEFDEDEGIQLLHDPGPPGLFGIPWRWILIPALLLVFLLVTLVVQADHPDQVQTSSPTANLWSAPLPPAPPVQRIPAASPWDDRYWELQRQWELERRLRELERRLALCSDPDASLSIRDALCR
jgi:predicted RNase H-like HicB family nuclease